ncbi:MAG: hypothetical protein EOO09_19460 [Chitinophagaceae bacterium]|nr:MAG: hypothetical protein EOO09_19460 [Chitinophagaceae bacterium]
MQAKIETIFREVLTDLGSDEATGNQLWSELSSAYTGRARYYHNLHHLDHLLAELLPLKDILADWQSIVFAIAYHDIIYSIRKSDNEERSAAVAQLRLKKAGFTDVRIARCVSHILYTKGHGTSPDPDANLFTDGDLSVLGSAPAKYQEYVKQIRREYGLYPSFVYNPGRIKVLSHFLAMPQIFKTDFFRDRYESQARINLQWELGELKPDKP